MRLSQCIYTLVKRIRQVMVVEVLPDSEDCNCYAVRAAARHVTQHYDQFLLPTRLRTTQFSSGADRRMKVLRLTKGGEKRLEVARRQWSAAQASFERVFAATRPPSFVHCCEPSWQPS